MQAVWKKYGTTGADVGGQSRTKIAHPPQNDSFEADATVASLSGDSFAIELASQIFFHTMLASVMNPAGNGAPSDPVPVPPPYEDVTEAASASAKRWLVTPYTAAKTLAAVSLATGARTVGRTHA